MEQERRLWGYYQVLYTDDYCKIKHLYIDAGKNISYQYHLHRAEYWTVVSGVGKLVLEGQPMCLQAGDSVRIKVGQRHTIRNEGDSLLIIHEIQTGDLLEETDIVRESLPDCL